jgi:accessory colonization factor AcfC
MGNRNKQPVTITTTIDPDLKAWAQQHNVNFAQIIRLALQDFRDQKFTVIHLREVIVEKRKEKPLDIKNESEIIMEQ